MEKSIKVTEDTYRKINALAGFIIVELDRVLSKLVENSLGFVVSASRYVET